jgi:uncharacterized membrane protein
MIDRPVDEVFAFFTDPANDRRWRTHVREISAPGPLEPGAVVHQVVEGPGGRGIPADMRVTAWEPGARYAFQVVAGPARPSGDFRFRSVAGGTEVSFALSAQLRGWRRILTRPVQRSMNGEMLALDRAKDLLEGL